MKKFIAISTGVVLVFAFVVTASAAQPADKGFDDFGYNETANNFVGTCLSWHMGKFGSTDAQAQAYCGLYSNDKLKMTWNDEWNRGNDEGWTDLNGYFGAWTDNMWNGMGPDGSGETWHYRFRWVGDCTEGELLPDGGYCIWGQFEVSVSHGTYEDFGHMVHLWYTHATPSGYGGYPLP